MVCEESTRELRKKQEQLKSRTLWLQEMKQAIIKKTRLCMLIMAGIFFLIQSGLYVCVPQRYQGSILHMVQWGKWGLLAGEVIIYAVLKDSEMEGV